MICGQVSALVTIPRIISYSIKALKIVSGMIALGAILAIAGGMTTYISENGINPMLAREPMRTGGLTSMAGQLRPTVHSILGKAHMAIMQMSQAMAGIIILK